MKTKSLRDVAAASIEVAQKEEKLKKRAKRAAGKVAKGLKWLTSDDVNENRFDSRGYSNIGHLDFRFLTSDELITKEITKVASYLNSDPTKLVIITSTTNPTWYTRFKKILTSKNWIEADVEDIYKNVAWCGKLICKHSGLQIPAVASHYDDGNTVPCVSYIVKDENKNDFIDFVSKTFFT